MKSIKERELHIIRRLEEALKSASPEESAFLTREIVRLKNDLMS